MRFLVVFFLVLMSVVVTVGGGLIFSWGRGRWGWGVLMLHY